MERVAFLLEDTGERLGCLLNPDSLVMRRSAGIRSRQSAGGQLTGAGLSDDPLIFTGGGRTELDLDLLFDVTLAGSSITTEDVRDLTRPLWELAENAVGNDGYGRPRIVRFVWGKAWNIPAVVTAVAERLEFFAPSGAAQRSWLRLRLRRVSEPITRSTSNPPPAVALISPEELALLELTAPLEEVNVVETRGGLDSVEREASGGVAASELMAGERLDVLAARFYGPSVGVDVDTFVAALWRVIAMFNDIDDPLRILPGVILRIPPLSRLRKSQ